MESHSPEIGKPPVRAAFREFDLADFDEMWNQLEGMHDPGTVQEQFLEVILEQSSTRVTGAGLTFFLSQSIAEFTESNNMEEVVGVLLLNRVPDYLHVLISDPEIREDTLSLWDEMTEGVKQQDRLRDPVLPKMPRRLKKAYRKPAHTRTAAEQARVRALERRLGRGANGNTAS